MTAATPHAASVIDRSAVSVIIPAYNSAGYLTEAIDSAYSQTVEPAEVIVVNDGSTDNTELLLARLAKALPRTFEWITQPNSGPGSARNAGVSLAKGDFIAFLDSDDLWAPDKLARHLAHFAAEPHLTLSFTARTITRYDTAQDGSLELRTEERRLGVSPKALTSATGEPMTDATAFYPDPSPDPEVVLASLMSHPTIGTSSVVMVRRAAFEKVPKFKERSSVDDWTMWLHMALRGMRFGFIPDALVEYRWHNDNLTSDRRRQLSDICVMLDEFNAVADLPWRLRKKIRLRRWRAYWHLATAIEAIQHGDKDHARHHIMVAARVHPASVRPGWARMLGIGLCPP